MYIPDHTPLAKPQRIVFFPLHGVGRNIKWKNCHRVWQIYSALSDFTVGCECFSHSSMNSTLCPTVAHSITGVSTNKSSVVFNLLLAVCAIWYWYLCCEHSWKYFWIFALCEKSRACLQQSLTVWLSVHGLEEIGGGYRELRSCVC